MEYTQDDGHVRTGHSHDICVLLVFDLVNLYDFICFHVYVKKRSLSIYNIIYVDLMMNSKIHLG